MCWNVTIVVDRVEFIMNLKLYMEWWLIGIYFGLTGVGIVIFNLKFEYKIVCLRSLKM